MTNLGQDKQTKDAVNGLATFALGWVLGVVMVYVLSASPWGDEITIGKESLGDLDVLGKVIFGLVFTSVAGTLYDFKKAIDSSDSARKPSLIPGSSDWGGLPGPGSG